MLKHKEIQHYSLSLFFLQKIQFTLNSSVISILIADGQRDLKVFYLKCTFQQKKTIFSRESYEGYCIFKEKNSSKLIKKSMLNIVKLILIILLIRESKGGKE